MDDIAAITATVDELAPEITRLSDEIWDRPLLRWAEFDSVERHIAVAEAHGFTVERELGGIPTAFWAQKGHDGPLIGILGEFDALAGLSQASGVAEQRPNPQTDNPDGHGCGHNLLGAGGLATAIAAAAYLEAHGLPGRIRYYGCPAEEAGASKTFMVQSGCFDGVDAVLAWHPAPITSAYQFQWLATVQARFRFTGTAAHAGAAPAMGRSALDALELMNVGVNFLREHMPDTARVHYAITDAGGESPNVVQARAAANYLVRAQTVAETQALFERVVKIAQGAALMTETTVQVDFDGGTSEHLPNATLEKALHANLESIGDIPFDAEDHRIAAAFSAASPAEAAGTRRMLGLPDDVDLFGRITPLGDPRRRPLMTGSSDVGDVAWTVPLVQMNGCTCAVGTAIHGWQMVAQGKLPYAHKGMLHTAKALAATAIDLATNPDLVAAARTEFDQLIARTPYRSPLLDGAIAPPLRR